MNDYSQMFAPPPRPMGAEPVAERRYDGQVRMPALEPPTPKQQIRKMLADLLDNL